MTKRILAGALAAIALTGVVAAGGAAAVAPSPTPKPGGLSRAQAADIAATPTGDCAGTGVVCKPDVEGSCTGNTSQSTPPTSIRVYDPTYTGADHIRVVPFETYVEDVLPNEWVDSWDGDNLKAGAVAITSYAWYWATHFGGYVGTNSKATCFDVTHDTNFQKFVNGSAKTNSTSKVQQVFPNAIRRDGSVIEASYLAALNPNYTDANPVPDTVCGQDADGKTLSQTGGEVCNEDSTGNKWPVILKLYYGQDVQLATTQQLRTQHDFQYLHRSTPAVFTNGAWTIRDGYNSGNGTRIVFGQKGDLPVVNTVGDGFARVGVFRPSTATWYRGSPTGVITSKVRFGNPGDIPVAAHYNSLTATTQIAVFRPSTRVWYLGTPTGSIASSVQYGEKGDIPVPGIWSGTTTDSIAVFRPSTGTWWLRGVGSVRYGQNGDIPVPADYDGNGTTDIAIYRPSTHQFWVRGQSPVTWGLTGDIPVIGDFNGDGKSDLAIYRPSKHTVYAPGQAAMPLPVAGTPIGAAPYHQ
jgi:hypothetical protein